MSKILLIEDDIFLSSLLKNRFQKEGFDIQLVGDGNEAMKAVKDQKPDLILLDIILPGKSGFEVLEEMRTDPHTARIPVMIISNLGQESDVEKGKELGVVDYLVKSRVSIDFLVQKAKELLPR